MKKIKTGRNLLDNFEIDVDDMCNFNHIATVNAIKASKMQRFTDSKGNMEGNNRTGFK